MSARQRAAQPNNALQESTSAGYGSHRIYANVSLNSSAPVRFMVDTGADVSILSTASAKLIKLNMSNTSGTLNLVGVTGAGGAPLVNLAMKIENQPAFVTQVAVTNSNFNLLCLRDLSRVFDVNIRGGKATLVPRGQAGIAAINTIPSPLVITKPTLDLSPEQINIGVGIVTVLLVLGVLS